jgi:hypothetical protein
MQRSGDSPCKTPGRQCSITVAADPGSSNGRTAASEVAYRSSSLCPGATALSSRGLGRRPLTAVTRVRIPLGLNVIRGERSHLRAFSFYSGQLGHRIGHARYQSRSYQAPPESTMRHGSFSSNRTGCRCEGIAHTRLAQKRRCARWPFSSRRSFRGACPRYGLMFYSHAFQSPPRTRRSTGEMSGRAKDPCVHYGLVEKSNYRRQDRYDRCCRACGWRRSVRDCSRKRRIPPPAQHDGRGSYATCVDRNDRCNAKAGTCCTSCALFAETYGVERLLHLKYVEVMDRFSLAAAAQTYLPDVPMLTIWRSLRDTSQRKYRLHQPLIDRQLGARRLIRPTIHSSKNNVTRR